MGELFSTPWIKWTIIFVGAMLVLWIVFAFARRGASTSSREKLNQSEMRKLEQKYTEGKISKEEFDRRKEELTREMT
jgi:uncharacterized membrane protein